MPESTSLYTSTFGFDRRCGPLQSTRCWLFVECFETRWLYFSAQYTIHFGKGQSRDVLCRACRRARRDTVVTTVATSTTRVQNVATALTGVDMSTSLFQKLFLILMQIQSTED